MRNTYVKIRGPSLYTLSKKFDEAYVNQNSICCSGCYSRPLIFFSSTKLVSSFSNSHFFLVHKFHPKAETFSTRSTNRLTDFSRFYGAQIRTYYVLVRKLWIYIRIFHRLYRFTARLFAKGSEMFEKSVIKRLYSRNQCHETLNSSQRHVYVLTPLSETEKKTQNL